MNYFHKDKEVHYYSDLQIAQGHAKGLTPLTEQELEAHLNPPVSVEQLAGGARAERDSRITSVRWRVERHRDEVDMGLTPTEPIEPLLAYIQALRDVPQQAGFPHNITWPQLDDKHTGGDTV